MDKIKNIRPEEETEEAKQSADSGITSEAKDAGFRFFPGGSSTGFNFPKLKFGSLGRVGIILGSIFLILIILLGVPCFLIFTSARSLAASARELQDASKSQDLDKMHESLGHVKRDLNSFDGKLKLLGWTQVIPYLGGYWKDANSASKGGIAGVEAGEIILKTIEPYSDILGLNGGKQAEDGQKTAEDRINFVVETIHDIVPQLTLISQKTVQMAEHFNRIDPNRYPESFKGKKVREPLREGIDLINEINDLVTGGKPVLEQAPYLLGTDSERTYLLLFQNDKELRPTGGFLTAYSIVKVKKGKFEPVSSSDIYSLDQKLKSKIPAPDPIKKYLPLVNYWNLRDMNLSPDFKVSMDTFKENYDKAKAPVVDGIIAVDTKVVVDILKVIGQIGVPGFGNFSANDDPRCNCANVIYELEDFADVAGPVVFASDLGGKIVYKPPHADNRKQILGPLMNSILANAMGQPKEKLPGLFEAGFNALREKHVLFYFGEGEVQKAMEAFNLTGRLKDFDGDYLHINDTNFAGAKSNLYVQEEVELKVDRQKDGDLHTLTIKYKNPQKHDGWLNGPYRDWFRVYVPKGSTLVDSSGSSVPVTAAEDLGKSVFEGFFELRPEAVIELKLIYKTPSLEKDYKLLIQKQPGTDTNAYTVTVGRNKEEFPLKTDKELHF